MDLSAIDFEVDPDELLKQILSAPMESHQSAGMKFCRNVLLPYFVLTMSLGNRDAPYLGGEGKASTRMSSRGTKHLFPG